MGKLHYFLTSRYRVHRQRSHLHFILSASLKQVGAPFLKRSRSESLGSTSFTLRQSSCSGNVGGQPTDDEVETNGNVKSAVVTSKKNKQDQ